MISVKKLLAMLMTMAIAVVLGLGTVGCSKKEEKEDRYEDNHRDQGQGKDGNEDRKE